MIPALARACTPHRTVTGADASAVLETLELILVNVLLRLYIFPCTNVIPDILNLTRMKPGNYLVIPE